MIEWTLALHIVTFLTIMPIGIIVNRKLYHNIKNEVHRENGKVIQRILKTYSLVQCTLPVLCHFLIIPHLTDEIIENTSFYVHCYVFAKQTEICAFRLYCRPISLCLWYSVTIQKDV